MEVNCPICGRYRLITTYINLDERKMRGLGGAGFSLRIFDF